MRWIGIISLMVAACTVFDGSLVEVDAGAPVVDGSVSDAEQGQDGGEDTAPDARPGDDAGTAGDAGVQDVGLDAELDAPADTALDAPPACVPGPDGVWVWNPAVLRENAEENLTLIAEAGFGRVFLEAEALATEDSQVLVDIVAAAAAHCIEVDLLFGYAPWARTPMHGYIRMLVRRALAQFGPGDIMPHAIHLDVEPHTLEEWTTDQASIADQWVSMLEGVALDAGNVPLIADIPFWYHEVMLERAGETISLLHWTLRAASGVTILAYRDTAEGANGIVELSRPSLLIADAVGGTVAVGLETHCGVEPTYVTFCEEGRAVFDTEMSRARSFFDPYTSFMGMAVHSWTSYQTLIP